MNSREETLKAKVGAVNKANAYANKIYPLLVEAFKPFVGAKILKVDGTFLKSVAEKVPGFESSVWLNVYRYSSEYSLVFVVKTCESLPPHSCVYHEVSLYVGEFKGAVLSKVNDDKPFNLRTDYTPEEITAKRVAWESAKRVADELHGELHPFGESDR